MFCIHALGLAGMVFVVPRLQGFFLNIQEYCIYLKEIVSRNFNCLGTDSNNIPIMHSCFLFTSSENNIKNCPLAK